MFFGSSYKALEGPQLTQSALCVPPLHSCFPCLSRWEIRKVGIEPSQGNESYSGAACCSRSLWRDFKGITHLKEPFTILNAVPCFTKHTNFILMTFQVLKQVVFPKLSYPMFVCLFVFVVEEVGDPGDPLSGPFLSFHVLFYHD